MNSSLPVEHFLSLLMAGSEGLHWPCQSTLNCWKQVILYLEGKSNQDTACFPLLRRNKCKGGNIVCIQNQIPQGNEWGHQLRKNCLKKGALQIETFWSSTLTCAGPQILPLIIFLWAGELIFLNLDAPEPCKHSLNCSYS